MLTETQVRKAQPNGKDYKLADERGLYLFITRKGAKSWRMKYRIGRREKRLVFGLYPDITLAEARERRDEARRLVRDGKDPAVERQKAKLAIVAQQADTFEKLAREWHSNEKGRWSDVHASDVLRSLERDIFPEIGALPIADVDVPVVLAALRKIEARGSIETARRCRQRIEAVFGYGISEGKANANPAAVVTKALKPLPKRGKQPAMVDIDALRQLLIDAEKVGAQPVTKLASRLLALTSQRPGVVRGLPWTEFEGIDWESEETDNPLWRIPPARMKLILDRKDEEAFEHVVPLATQSVDVLRAVRRLTGRIKLVFPSQRHSHRPLSENAIGYLYNRVGYHGRHVPHGWRAAFSTIMNERAEREGRLTDAKVIDLMLAHLPQNKVEGAYNRAAFMPRRREIAQEWADLLLEGLEPAEKLLVGPRR